MEAKTIDLRHLIRKCPECGQQYSSDSVFCPFDGTKLADVSSWAPSKDSLLGKTVDGRYRVDSVLGEGGMGTVYEVRHTTLSRSFALKVLRKDLAEDEELAARFIQEAKATAAVRHPQVVSISDFGRLDDGRPYFVMELLQGQTLSQLIKSGGPVPVARGARIVSKVARGLAAAHASGVVHRDLKPENIVLIAASSDDDVRIVDFGAAMLQGATRLTKAGVVFGTPHYMSPEQAAGNPVDHRADVYSLGVIMYEMFTGRVPFEGDTYMGVLTQHLYVRPTPPSKVLEASSLGALEAVILHALEKRPEERYQSMGELEDAVMRVLRLGSADTTPAPESGVRSHSHPHPRGMADTLEAPTLEEIRESVAGLHAPSPWPLRFMIAAIAIAALAVVVALFIRKSAPENEAATPAPTESAPVGSLAPVVSVVPTVIPSAPAAATAVASSTPIPTVRPIRTAASSPTGAKTASGEFKDPWK
jgi:serine/threonine-protein kinase